jgi:hypothetical protein
VVTRTASINQIYGAAEGRYATSVAHPSATMSKATARAAVSRGGFGATGHGASGGG